MSRMRVSGRLSGKVEAMPSKSMAHRAVLCAALSGGESRISHIALSRDIQATIACAKALGLADFSFAGDELRVIGRPRTVAEEALLPCGESGSTLRFFLPLSCLLAKKARFVCEGRLTERPLEPLKSLLMEKGVAWPGSHEVSGRPAAGTFEIAGNVSSQFISGLLFALPLLEKDSVIRLTTPLESAGYVELTRQMQAAFGVRSEWKSERELLVPGNQTYRPSDVRVEGDYSHAAFFAVAGQIGGEIAVSGLLPDSRQGDKAVLEILARMGGNIEIRGGTVFSRPSPLSGTVIDAAQIPDLVPILAVAGAAAKGETRIVHAQRLRIKESDRLAATAAELAKMGAEIEETPDGLVIRGGRPLHGAEIDSHNDHRIAMAAAVAAGLAAGETVIGGAECVAKSAPQFWEEFRSLGGNAVEQ